MSAAVERSLTGHRLTITLCAPAVRNARVSPITPSPFSSRPSPVSHADNVTRQVRFSVRAGRLEISSATELGAGEHAVEAQYSGEDMEIGYNAAYLLDLLRNIPTERVAFRLKTALSRHDVRWRACPRRPREIFS